MPGSAPIPAVGQLKSGVQPGSRYTLKNLIAMIETKRDRKAWIRGGTTQCEPPAKPNKLPRRLVLLGAPGVGKGTQAELLNTIMEKKILDDNLKAEMSRVIKE